LPTRVADESCRRELPTRVADESCRRELPTRVAADGWLKATRAKSFSVFEYLRLGGTRNAVWVRRRQLGRGRRSGQSRGRRSRVHGAW
jgi:hypothetical protein